MKISFQARVHKWMLICFGEEVTADIAERSHRFLEESLELTQSIGCTRKEAHQLVDYVFNRPAGVPAQEVGGVMLTLAALCGPAGLDMRIDGENELARVNQPDVIAKIRLKQQTKPHRSPLPGTGESAETPSPSSRAPVTDDELEQWAKVRADDAGHLARELVMYRRAPSASHHRVMGSGLTDFRKFVDLIEARAMACDGPVTPFLEELNAASDAEKQRFVGILRSLYATEVSR